MNVNLAKDAGTDSLAGILILKKRKIIGGEIPGEGKHQKGTIRMMGEVEETITVIVTKQESIKEVTPPITDDRNNVKVKDLNAIDLNAQGMHQIRLRNWSYNLEVKMSLKN